MTDRCSIRMRNNIDTKFHVFHTFPERPRIPMAFLDNVKNFIEEFGQTEEGSIEGVNVWSTFLVNGKGIGIPLLMLEEPAERSPKTFCRHCLRCGWHEFSVSKLRYHFIIPATDKWTHPVEADFLECNSHLLHGMIHGNGYGHILSIKGKEGGSKHLTGHELMELWERMCLSLHARAISVDDMSKKRGMCVRLLHGISYEKTWFQKWEYGPTDTRYMSSLEKIRLLKLGSSETWQSSKVPELAKKYHDVDGNPLEHLFARILELLHEIPEAELGSNSGENSSYQHFYDVAMKSDTLKRYNLKTVMDEAQDLVEAIVDETKKAGNTVSLARRDLDKISTNSSMLNILLPRMQNTLVGGHLFYRKKLQGHGNEFHYSVQILTRDYNAQATEIRSDLTYLYELIQSLDVVQEDLRVVLDSRRFIKYWNVRKYAIGDVTSLVCMYSKTNAADNLTLPFYPAVHVFLTPNQKAGELQTMVEKALRDTYHVMANIEVSHIVGYEQNDDAVFVVDPEANNLVSVTGPGVEKNNLPYDMLYEGGVVKCEVCKVNHHDGNPVIQCHKCCLFHHKKCCGLNNEETVLVFLCKTCRPN